MVLAGALAGVGFGAALRPGRPARARRASLLRPPGARHEGEFLGACLRCGQCVEVCPAGALHLADLDAGLAAGTPWAETRDAACDLCAGEDRLRCIEVCPSGALREVGSEREIEMGLAVLDRDRCLSWQGTVCRACWHACPFPNEAIKLDWRARPTVDAEACIGCGKCDHACLSEPSALSILPQAARSTLEASTGVDGDPSSNQR